MTNDVIDFMQKLEEKAQQVKREAGQAVTEKMDDDMRRIIADAVMAMRNLGATDEQIAFRLEVAQQIVLGDLEAAEDMEEDRQTGKSIAFSFLLD